MFEVNGARRNHRQKSLVLGQTTYGRRRNRKGDLYRSLSGLMLFSFLILSIFLLVLEKTGNRQLRAWQSHAHSLAVPVLELASVPAGYIQRSLDRMTSLYQIDLRLTKLRRENLRLRARKWKVLDLQQRNQQLKALLNSVDEPHLKYVSGRIISATPGLFGKTMLVNLGRHDGIDVGYAVINEQGLIGRTVEANNRTSKVLLLTDKASRIPVTIGKASIRAIILGNGTSRPQIAFLPEGTTPHAGDLVFTSGEGGDLPKGLMIGHVTKDRGMKNRGGGAAETFYINLKARSERTEYVSILTVEQPGLASRRTAH